MKTIKTPFSAMHSEMAAAIMGAKGEDYFDRDFGELYKMTWLVCVDNCRFEPSDFKDFLQNGKPRLCVSPLPRQPHARAEDTGRWLAPCVQRRCTGLGSRDELVHGCALFCGAQVQQAAGVRGPQAHRQVHARALRRGPHAKLPGHDQGRHLQDGAAVRHELSSYRLCWPQLA